MFSISWRPDIAGDYRVIRNIRGSQSYYGTYAETSFAADAAATTAPTTQPVDLGTTQMYVLGIGAAIIVVIAIVGALLMTIRKRA